MHQERDLLRLERDLLTAGEAIVRVPPKMMAHARDAARTYGKSDPIDALAVARAALREPDLPAARLDDETRQDRDGCYDRPRDEQLPALIVEHIYHMRSGVGPGTCQK